MVEVEVTRVGFEQFGFGRPAASSSAVKRAMLYAAATVSLIAPGEKSDVLALPRFLPMNTVTPTILSRLCSIVSTSPRRTDTDRPSPSEISVAASVAPSAFAWRRMSEAISLSWSCVCGK